MSSLNVWAIVAATVAALVVSFVWYAVFGYQLAELSDAYAEAGTPPIWKTGVEMLRSLAVAAVLANFAAQIGVTGWAGAIELGLVAWLGFPVAILAGSVLWEKVPWRLALVHSGDWLLKLVVIALIVGLWRAQAVG